MDTTTDFLASSCAPTDAELRQFLLDAYTSNDFDAFCFDNYREVRQNFTAGQNQNDRILALLDYVGTRSQLPGLYNHLRQSRPERFNQTFYSAAKLLGLYRETALKEWDILDLTGLPEDDRHLATKNFILRQLYIPLRLHLEQPADPNADSGDDSGDSSHWARAEQRRHLSRLLAAGRSDAGELPPTPGQTAPASLGALLSAPGAAGEAPRVVLLGDPGAGKSTLFRWLATACLLRRQGSADLALLPDHDTLPANFAFLPILIRCRDLSDHARLRAIEDLLAQSLAPWQFPEPTRARLVHTLRAEMDAGRALLLLDGLDELTDPRLRLQFCDTIKGIARAFPRAPIVATSRIVGYREIGHPLRRFAQAIVADLTRDAMDDFARCWTAATIRQESLAAPAARALAAAIHSSDRVERLAANPMLLTVLALVHRKIGRLPHRREQLYLEAVQVLLNWRSEIDDPLEDKEAFPQLAYIAYSMCQRGLQRLPESQILTLLEDVRREYPHRRHIAKRTPEDFLKLLERRSSLLIQSGVETIAGLPENIYEFRHLTFQEYFAARALLDSVHPGYLPDKFSLPERLAPLAGEFVETSFDIEPGKELTVTENWRETLRLVLSACPAELADNALLALATPSAGEDANRTARPRAIIAALCLADEPDVSESTGEEVIRRLVSAVTEGDGNGYFLTSLSTAARDLARSEIWRQRLLSFLIGAFLHRSDLAVTPDGGLAGMIAFADWPADENADAARHRENLLAIWLDALTEPTTETRTLAAFSLLLCAHGEKFPVDLVPTALDKLSNLCRSGLFADASRFSNSSPAESHAAAWAMFWLGRKHDKIALRWASDSINTDFIIRCFTTPSVHLETRLYLIPFLTALSFDEAIPFLGAALQSNNANMRLMAAQTLSKFADSRAIALFLNACFDDNNIVRRDAFKSWIHLTLANDEIGPKLLSRDLDGSFPWLDPANPIPLAYIAKAARELRLPEADIRRRYEEISRLSGGRIKLGWDIAAQE